MILCNIPALNLLFFSWIILGIFQKHFLEYWKNILQYDGDYYFIITEIFHEMFLCKIFLMIFRIIFWNISIIFQIHFVKYSKIYFESGKKHCRNIMVISYESFFCYDSISSRVTLCYHEHEPLVQECVSIAVESTT